jgi:hypothetical protein
VAQFADVRQQAFGSGRLDVVDFHQGDARPAIRTTHLNCHRTIIHDDEHRGIFRTVCYGKRAATLRGLTNLVGGARPSDTEDRHKGMRGRIESQLEGLLSVPVVIRGDEHCWQR